MRARRAVSHAVLLVATGLLVNPALMRAAMAQDASPYVPLQHWTMPYVEHLIARGVIPDPTPLTRPLKRADVVRVLREVDTLTVGEPVARTVRRFLRGSTATQQDRATPSRATWAAPPRPHPRATPCAGPTPPDPHR